ncbi:hypothetical protein ABVT39_015195 [Epinephelus coioides]
MLLDRSRLTLANVYPINNSYPINDHKTTTLSSLTHINLSPKETVAAKRPVCSSITMNLFIPSEWLPTMSKYITNLEVSLDKAEEQMLQSQGFKKIPTDLNKGAGGNQIYVWYKKDASFSPITRIQFTFREDMATGLITAGYTKIPKDLNAGTKGVAIYLWYFQGSTKHDYPIEEIEFSVSAATEAPKFGLGLDRLALDLNRGIEGDWIYTWVKREKETYVCDVTATAGFGSDADYFKAGYTRMDEDINRGAGGEYVSIWYRLTTDPKLALSDLKVSTNDEESEQYQQQDYTPVNVNLNEGTGGNAVYMWWKKEERSPIRDVTMILNMEAVDPYEKAGVIVIKRNLNAGNDGRYYILPFRRLQVRGYVLVQYTVVASLLRVAVD